MDHLMEILDNSIVIIFVCGILNIAAYYFDLLNNNEYHEERDEL